MKKLPSSTLAFLAISAVYVAVDALASIVGAEEMLAIMGLKLALLLAAGVTFFLPEKARDHGLHFLDHETGDLPSPDPFPGRRAPYEFHCTLVRAEINHFAKIFSEHPTEELCTTANEFFTDVAHVAARYGGVVGDVVGGEIFFYFPDARESSPQDESMAAALATVRDIKAAATKICELTLKKRGYPFTVKFAIVQGRVRYMRMAGAYRIVGPPLSEASKILAQISEKDGNVAVFEERLVHKDLQQRAAQKPALLRNRVTIHPFARVCLKGSSKEVRLESYAGHKPVRTVLNHDLTDPLTELGDYRSDTDLVEIIAWVRGTVRERGYKSAARAIAQLGRVRITSSGGLPRDALLDWIEELLDKKDGGTGSLEVGETRLLASALRLFECLVPKSEFDERCARALERAAKIEDRRVMANALDSLSTYMSHLKKQGGANILSLIDHADNRIAANAIVQEGKRALSAYVIRRLRKMLDSKRASFTASALFAMGELAHYHRQRDELSYRSQESFHELIGMIAPFAQHPDPRVRRQALIAARKAGEPALIATIREAAERNPLGELAREVEEHLTGLRRAA